MDASKIVVSVTILLGIILSVFLILCLYRSSRRRNFARRSRSATYHADTGRITGDASENNNSSRSSRRSRRNRANTNHQVSGTLQTGGGQLNNVEAGQILLAQRLGLIQHLPLIVWERNKKKDKLRKKEDGEHKNHEDFQTDTSNPNGDQNDRNTQPGQDHSSPINTASSNTENMKNNTENTSDNATFETDQPPSYEKSNILPTSFNQTTSSSNRHEILPDSSSSEKDENECTICMEDFEEGNHIRYLPCMHFYGKVI